MRNLLSLLVLVLLSVLHPAHAGGARGTLLVVNQRDHELVVLVDGAAVGPAAPHAETAFRLRTGAHELELRSRSGEPALRARFALGAGAVYTVQVAPENGELEVRNGAGTTLRLVVDGGGVGELAPGQTRVLSLKAGAHTLRATYVQLGRERELVSQQVGVNPGQRALVRLAPVDEGLVLVENRTGRDASLLVDGRAHARVPSGASVEVVTRLGRVSLSLVENNRVLASTALAVGAYQDLRWRAEAPTVGDLLVLNPHPIPVVVVDARGRSYTVAARGQLRLNDVPVGATRLEARRPTGEPIARAQASVKPYEVATWTVPTPSTGLVAVYNADGRAVSVWVDGVRTANLAPRESARLLLALGTHRVQVRDVQGHLLLDARATVDPYTERALTVGGGEVATRHEQRRGGDRGHAEHQRPY